MPCPAVPEAVITGLGNVTDPTVVVRSTSPFCDQRFALWRAWLVTER